MSNVVEAEVIGVKVEMAPEQVSMVDQPGFMVYQKTSQCCRCCCLQPNIDWIMHDYKEGWGHEDQLPIVMNIKEEANYFGRCCSFCYPGFRQTKYTVRAGESETSPALFTHEKPFTCSHCPLVMLSDGGPVRVPCCCCLPYLETRGPDGELLGVSKYVCDSCCFVPKYSLEDANGNLVYRVRPDTCCGGICVRCRTSGGGRGKCFRIPFIIRNADYEPVDDAKIEDLWAGMKHECCTNREMYGVKFPAGADDATRKALIGMTLLIDITMNEQDQ